MSTTEERLNAVIKSLEKGQEKNYSSITHLVLSYLYDIRDDKLPSWVLKKKPVKKKDPGQKEL